MSERRFTEKPDLNPQAVMSLADDHPAMRENRTLFPSTVVTVTEDEPDRLLVSGRNNRKIGATVEKGKFKGYGIYCLSLEERATCPTDCAVRGFCFGNGMQMARRHRIGDADVFYDRLGFEIVELLDQEPCGLSIRLHVLGDFPSVEYVSFWKEVLDEHPNVMCWGYTHRAPTNWGGDEIGDAIQAVKDAHPDRFRIRWSSEVARADGAIVIDHVPDGPRTDNRELVCPAQTDATACCATCGLCWEQPRECIAFVKHRRMSAEQEASAVMDAMRQPENILIVQSVQSEPAGDLRRVHPLKLTNVKPMIVPANREPECRMVAPTDLLIEESYQRGLSGKSLKLIRKIVAGWDWAKFKPPVCAEDEGGLFVIDGQHTAIAAASHPSILRIPVMVVSRDRIEDRAEAFVSQNTERVVMSPLQIFHAEVVANDKAAIEILKSAIRNGANIPRSIPVKGKSQPGDLVSVSAVRRVYSADGIDKLDRVIKIAVASGVHPINSTLIYALQYIVKGGPFEDAQQAADEDIARAIAAISNLEACAASMAADCGVNRFRAAASLIQTEIFHPYEDAA